MKLPDKYGGRLHTKNFRRVISKAAISIDYSPELKIVEIEYHGGKIYHYLGMSKKVWNTLVELDDKDESLGTYINQDFKKMADEKNRGYYELIIVHKPHSKVSPFPKKKTSGY